MAEKLMYIPNDDTQKYPFWFKRLYTQIKEPSNQNLIKVPKAGKLTNKKMLL